MASIHFYMFDPVGFEERYHGLHGYHETKEAINSMQEVICTTQLAILQEPLLAMGHRVFIHPRRGVEYEIKLGQNESMKREIRESHNLLKLLMNGEFNWGFE